MRYTLLLLAAVGAAAQPVVSNIRAANVTHSSMTIVWDNSAVPNKIRVRYGLTAAYENGAGGGYQGQSVNSYQLYSTAFVTALAPNTTYHFCPQSSTDGGATWSACVNFVQSTAPLPAIHPAYPIPPAPVDTTYPDTSGYTVRNVAANCADLQSHIDAAAAAQHTTGSVIQIPAGTTCKGAYTLKGSSNRKSYTAANIRTSTSTITLTGHGFSEGQKIKFGGSSGPGSAGPDPFRQTRGVKRGEDYYVKAVGANSFQVSTTPGGPVYEFVTSTFTADAAANTFTVPSTSVKLQDGQTIQVKSSGTLPGGLVIDTTYYVKNPSSSTTFQLAATAGGAAIDITSAGSGTHSFMDQGSGGTVMAWPPPANWIIIRTATPDAQFVPRGVRATPAWQSRMATLKPAGRWFGAYPVTVGTDDLAHHYRFVGIEFTHDDTASTEIATTIDPAGYFGFFSSNRDASSILLDRCYIHGLGFPNRIYRAITTFDGENMGIINSYWDKLDWWHPYRTGVSPSLTNASTVTISAGTYFTGPASRTLSAPVTITRTGGAATGTGRVYFDLNGQLIVLLPSGMTATCSGYSPCSVQTAASPAFPLNTDNRMACAPVASLTMSGGMFNGVSNPGEPSTGSPEGAQSFIAGEGPGPFLIENNYISGTGIPIHFDDTGNRFYKQQDYTVRRNYFTSPVSQIAGGAQSDGRRYYHRNHIEWKSGDRILVDGNIFEHNMADVSPLGVPVAIMATSGGSITDVKVSNNLFRHSASGLLVSGGIDSLTPFPRMGTRFQVVNNLFYRLDGFAWAPPHVRPNGVNGISIFGGSAEDTRIEHNTFYDARGTGSSWIHIGNPSEGISITDNVVFASSWLTTSEDQGKNSPSCTGYERALLDCIFRSGVGTTSYKLGGNTVISGWDDGVAASVARDPWWHQNNWAGSTLNIYGQSEIAARVGWLSPNTQNFRIGTLATNKSGGQQPATDGKDRGVDMDVLERAVGKIRLADPLNITPTSVTIPLTAPDRGTGCQILYGTGADITTYSRTAENRSSSYERLISVNGLTPGSAYQFLVLCENATEQPQGRFRTPSE